MITYNDTYWDAIRIEKAAIEVLTEKNQILQQENEEAKQREEVAKQREEEERRQKEEIKIKLAIKMKRYGESIEEIIKETGLTKEMIEKLNKLVSCLSKIFFCHN
jgi:hypothetical protein